MLDRVRVRMRARYAEARIRETKFLMTFDMDKVNQRLLILFSVFVTLTFLDVLTTLVALSLHPVFVELNPIASGLFRLDFPGFLAALALKYVPIIPMFYVVFLAPGGMRAVPFRAVKIAGLVALVGANLFYVGVVGSNSVNLLRYYFLAA